MICSYLKTDVLEITVRKFTLPQNENRISALAERPDFVLRQFAVWGGGKCLKF